MNCFTTGYRAPAAAPRTGRGESAPRRTSIPFAAIPHDIAADPRLSALDVRVLAALFYFARADTSCWPSDHSIAGRVHCHPGTVQRSLRYLEDLGYIRRQPARNPTGRTIHLTYREPNWERPRQTPVPKRRRVGGASAGAQGGQAPALANGDVIVEGLKAEEGKLPERSRPDASGSELVSLATEATLAHRLPATRPDQSECKGWARRGQAGPSEMEPEPAPPPIAAAPNIGPLTGYLIPRQPSRTRFATISRNGWVKYSSPAGPVRKLLTPAAAIPFQAKVPTPVPALPVTLPRQPIVAPPELQFPRLQRVGLGPRVASVGTSPAGCPPVSVPLTPEQQARLAAMPAASREQVLRWLATGDRVLVAEAMSKLRLQPETPQPPQTVPELLGRIRQDPSYPALAASGLAAAFQDQKSYSGYLRRCEEAWRGELNPDRLLSAYEQAMGPKARNPGAIFMVAVKRRE
ncbi:MAG TPA: helix-turn-helix domain-containing protein [Candidatus Methylomirabilis sp.]|nr:helix-turn-helix domain-containing protein [Candidatus Methylomirabilis sp.]